MMTKQMTEQSMELWPTYSSTLPPRRKCGGGGEGTRPNFFLVSKVADV